MREIFFKAKRKDNSKKNPNGIMTLNLDAQRRYYGHDAMDLCPECMKEFLEWMEEVK